VSGLKDEKLLNKQAYTKTEACKLYSRVFWIFLPNVIEIGPYNFELYRFKVGAFFETQCSALTAKNLECAFILLWITNYSPGQALK